MRDGELRRKLLENSIRTSELGKKISVPVKRKRQKFEDTHRRKTFWLRNEIADKVDEEIQEGRGPMTHIINTLLEEYFEKREH